MKLPELKIPWHPVAAKSASALAEELVREVGPQHVLYGKRVQAIAVRQDCDDVLFAIDGAPACAVVHLTWIMKTESDPKFPWTMVFSTIEEWEKSGMNSDHEDFMST